MQIELNTVKYYHNLCCKLKNYGCKVIIHVHTGEKISLNSKQVHVSNEPGLHFNFKNELMHTLYNTIVFIPAMVYNVHFIWFNSFLEETISIARWKRYKRGISTLHVLLVGRVSFRVDVSGLLIV